MKIIETQTTTYDIGDGFRIDVVKIGINTEIWTYHKNYGIKELEIAFENKTNIEELIKNNAETYKYYYEQEYMEK